MLTTDTLGFTPLTAGYDMDRLIQTQVFGLHVHDWKRVGNPSLIARRVRLECSTCHFREWGGYARGPSNFSSSASANEQLVGYMMQNGWALYLFRNVLGPTARIEQDGYRTGYSAIYRYPAPKTHYEAIARAALDALRLLPSPSPSAEVQP